MALFASRAITSKGKPPSGAYLLKMFIVCLSYVNLCFLNVWMEMNNRGTDAYRKYGETWQKLAAVTLDILILAIVLWGVLYLALWTGEGAWIRFVKWSAIIGLLLPANILRLNDTLLSSDSVSIPKAAGSRIVVLLAAAAAAILLLVKWERISTRVTTVLLILLAPIMPLAVGTAAAHIWQGPPHGLYPNKPLQPALPQSAGAPRVLWILFDEWDQALIFPERPAGLSLPELDRFQSRAFRANRAYSPSRKTIVSVPSLLTGKIFVNALPESWNEVMMVYDPGRAPMALSAQETIFSVARRCGFNVGIVGWYLPYCRLFPECTVCSWHPAIGPLTRGEYEKPYPGLNMMVLTLTRQFEYVPLLKRLGTVNLESYETPMAKAYHAISYGEIHDDMLKAITNPRLNLIFVHVNVPHLPAIHDVSREVISNDRNTTYLGNLRLVDRTLGDIRRTLEKAGMWDTSTILLTADHPLRMRAHERPEALPAVRGLRQHNQVPYLLRMPGETQGVVYDTPMNTIVTKDLLIAIMNRQVASHQQIAAWLDQHPPHL
jgi:Sulfatase